MSKQIQFDWRIITGEFSRFLIAGTSNTVVAYALYLILLGSVGYFLAYSISYASGVVFSYFLNSLFVFRTRTVISSFLKFPFVYVAQYLLGAVLLWVCVERLGIPKEIGLAFSIAVTVPFTYLASRFVLKDRVR